MDSIGDRLKAMGVNLGSHSKKADDSSHALPIDKVVEGAYYQTIYGETFTAVTVHDLDYRHGVINPYENEDPRLIFEWGKIGGDTSFDISKLVFLDTETSGLAGGTGTFAFLIGLGFFRETGFEVVQLFMRDPAQETSLLATLLEHLDEKSIIVTFNGKSFDIPLLNARLTMNGLSAPIKTVGHIDLLHLARKIWKDRLPSRALGDLEKEIIGFFRDEGEVPGFLIPQYYFDYLKTGDASPLRGVLYHNAVDIMSLAALYTYLSKILSQPSQSSLPTLDTAAVARLHEELGRLETAAALYKSSLSDGLPEVHFIKTIERFALMRRKQGRPDLAAQLWEEAAERGHIPALIELEKYYEHTVRDYSAAMHYIVKAFEILSSRAVPGYLRNIYMDDLIKRQKRLEIKNKKGESRL